MGYGVHINKTYNKNVKHNKKHKGVLTLIRFGVCIYIKKACE